MKKASNLLLASSIVLWLLSSCQASPPKEETVELTVFAAASLTEVLTQIAEDYQSLAPNVILTFNFDSSGTLKTQIQEGASCDLFLSAASKQIDQLDGAADSSVNIEGLDFVLQGTRVDLLENKVVLVVPEGNPAAITSYNDLAQRLSKGSVLLATGNTDVPVGQYTRKIFSYYALEEASLAAKGVLTYGSNVKEVASQVSEASVDCGIIYATDANSADLTIVDTAATEMCGRVIYPAAVLNISEHQAQAQAFLDYLKSEEAGAIFSAAGFTPLF